MFQSDRFVIVGLGATGYSCVRYLKKIGANVAVTDSRPTPPYLAALQKAYPEVEVICGHLDAALLAGASKIVLSPGIGLSQPEIAQASAMDIPIIGDIELFGQAVHAPIIAITGTNAKSTVTTLVGLMAAEAGRRVAVGGNLGIPALDLLEQHPDAQLFILELSSFQLETTYHLKPAVATVLNVTPDHMDRYENFTAYQQAKLRIYHEAAAIVCNRDDPLTECSPMQNQSKTYFTLQTPRALEFGLVQRDGQLFLAHGDQILLSTRELPIAGKHYQANALAALAIGHQFGLSMAPMLQVLRAFKGLPHRCQLVRVHNDVQWYNDSKGTNVGATEAAIMGLGSEIEGKLILIAGGVGKNADFKQLLPAMLKYVRHVVLIGEAAQEIASMIGSQIPLSFADSMEVAIDQAKRAARETDSVLLSPACASFDMFKNYEHRGQVFTEIVEKL